MCTMIEVHAHVLPGLDDGPADYAEAFALIAAYARQGVTDIICTSHFGSAQMQAEVETDYLARYREAYQLCAATFEKSEYPVRLHPGLELELVPDLLRSLKRHERDSFNPLTLAGSFYLLVELPKWVSGGLTSLDNILYSLQLDGYMPILAHPERISDFAASEEQLSLWVTQERICLQVNASSLVSLPNRTTEQQERLQRRRVIVDRLIRSGLVHLAASDGHDVIRRPPMHQEAWHILANQYREAVAQRLLQEKPAAILNKLPLQPVRLDVAQQPNKVTRQKEG